MGMLCVRLCVCVCMCVLGAISLFRCFKTQRDGRQQNVLHTYGSFLKVSFSFGATSHNLLLVRTEVGEEEEYSKRRGRCVIFKRYLFA